MHMRHFLGVLIGASKVGDLFILAQRCEELSGAETDGRLRAVSPPFLLHFHTPPRCPPSSPLASPLSDRTKIPSNLSFLFTFFFFRLLPQRSSFPAFLLFDSSAASC